MHDGSWFHPQGRKLAADVDFFQQEDLAPLRRPHTRAFAKLHGLSVRNLTLDDLNSATATARSQIVPRVDARGPAKHASKETNHTQSRIHNALVTTDGKIESAIEIRESRTKRKQLPNIPQDKGNKSTPQAVTSQLQVQEHAKIRQTVGLSPVSIQE